MTWPSVCPATSVFSLLFSKGIVYSDTRTDTQLETAGSPKHQMDGGQMMIPQIEEDQGSS